MSKELTVNVPIEVCGTVASGKSRISYLLSNYLRSLGIATEIDFLPDFSDKESYEEAMERNLDKVIENFID